MDVPTIHDPDRIRPIHVVMVCLLALTLAGTCLLTCGPFARLEGSKDWAEESLMRAIVHVLNVNYTQTTAQGVEIKGLVFGIGATLAAIAGGIALLLKPIYSDAGEPLGDAGGSGDGMRRQIPTLAAAQVMMIAYVVWSFLSTQWAVAPDAALGGSILLAVGVVWSLALGWGLNRKTAVSGAVILVIVCALTAVLAIAYHGVRNPVRRAAYPIGNPLFLAACLIPGVVVAVGAIPALTASVRKRKSSVLSILALIIAIAVILWAIVLSGSRGGVIALAAGILLIGFFALPAGRRAWFGGSVLVIGIIALAFAWPSFTAPSNTGRDASLRLRHYAWSYAVDLISDAPIAGQGQGGYVMLADAFASRDVLADPQALNARIAHAHSEWFEIAADLGAIGLTLAIGSLVLTLLAAIEALRERTDPLHSWMLIATAATLVALMIEESADVALRIAGFPAVYFTVIGLVWSLSRKPQADPWAPFLNRLARRRIVGIVALAVGLILLTASVADFRAARANYEIGVAIGERDFDRAVRAASSAARSRLSPQRRLESFERLCSTHLFIARENQNQALDRITRARATNPPDPTLSRLADDARTASEQHLSQARAALDKLVRHAPRYFDAGWLEFRLIQLRHVFARVDGDEALANRSLADAGRALANELQRRPYDSLIALNYADVARSTIDFADLFDVIARPLRYEAIAGEYTEFISRLAAADSFDEQFGQLWNTLVPTDDQPITEDPFAPEKLRIAALVRLLREDYARAHDAAKLAADLYANTVQPGTIGQAACWAEMAEYRFFSDPVQWNDAVSYALRALELLPDSTPGRQTADTVRLRMMTYYLAGSQEDAARDLLAAMTHITHEKQLDADIGRLYANMCRNMIRRSRGALPLQFNDWVRRAAELNPNDELVLRLQAQVMLDAGRLDDSVLSLRHALQRGANPAVVYEYVRLAHGLHSDHPGFALLERELRQALGIAPPTDAPAQNPANTTDNPPASADSDTITPSDSR